jgi:hypothetical protein
MKKWDANIVVQRKKNFLGYYPCEKEAARAYDERAGALGRPVNFPKKGQEQAEKRGAHGTVSRFVGVSWESSKSQWESYVSLEGSKKKPLGLFDDELDAARAYDRHARTLDKPLNFPGEGEQQAQKRNTSNFQGTHWNGKEWEAVIFGRGIRTYLGVFGSEVEAARAYDDHLVTVLGSSRFNFPEEGVGELKQANVEPKSKFVGVRRQRTVKGWWEANIKIDGKLLYLGTFESEEEAARVYDERAGGLLMPVNFPEEWETQARKPGSSKFRGVSKPRRGSKWEARISLAGKTTYLGTFESEEEAARAFDERAAPLGRAVNFLK